MLSDAFFSAHLRVEHLILERSKHNRLKTNLEMAVARFSLQDAVTDVDNLGNEDCITVLPCILAHHLKAANVGSNNKKLDLWLQGMNHQRGRYNTPDNVTFSFSSRFTLSSSPRPNWRGVRVNVAVRSIWSCERDE